MTSAAPSAEGGLRPRAATDRFALSREGKRIVEPVVAPEHLVANEECGRAEYATGARLFRQQRVARPKAWP